MILVIGALNLAEACAKLGAALGRQVRYVPVDDAAARSAMLGAGLDAWMTDALIELYQDYRRSGHDGYAAQISDAVKTVTGAPPRTLDQALRDIGAADGMDVNTRDVDNAARRDQ